MNKPRTYAYSKCISYSEVISHVKAASRTDVDPVWYEIAKTAALNGCKCNSWSSYLQEAGRCGPQGVTFLRPTACKKGYYNVLKTLAEHDGMRYTDIKHCFGCMPIVTISRLLDGSLIRHSDHKYYATDLGNAYLLGAKRYVKNRKV